MGAVKPMVPLSIRKRTPMSTSESAVPRLFSGVVLSSSTSMVGWLHKMESSLNVSAPLANRKLLVMEEPVWLLMAETLSTKSPRRVPSSVKAIRRMSLFSSPSALWTLCQPRMKLSSASPSNFTAVSWGFSLTSLSSVTWTFLVTL